MSEKVLMKGNEAMAEAAIAAGCRCFFGYPITPQTEVAAHMAKRMPKIGGTFLQAESEIAAINMVLGASSVGVRAMTSSSSPGISLKSEGISYLAGSDLPAVIVNIQRAGPGLGGIQPAQGDYYQATRGLGHGDFHILVLAPASVQELADLTMEAFDLADIYRMPVMVLGDGMLGQMMEPVLLKEGTGRTIPEKTWAAGGTHGERKHNIINSLYIEPDELEKLVLKRYEKYEQIEKTEARAEEYMTEDADIIVTAFGSTARIAKSAVKTVRAQGIKVGLIRPITLWPFPEKVYADAANRAKAFLCVEMNMGQMIDDVKLATNCRRPVQFYGRTGGMVPTPDEIVKAVLALAGGLN